MKTYLSHDGSILTDDLPVIGEGQSRKGVRLPDGRWARIGQTPHTGHPIYGDNSSYFLCQKGPAKLAVKRGQTLAEAAAELATDQAIVFVCEACGSLRTSPTAEEIEIAAKNGVKLTILDCAKCARMDGYFDGE